MDNVLIYGANGYTGRLIVAECLKHGIKPSIAGRNKQQIFELAQAHNLPWAVFNLKENNELTEWLKTGSIVIHCGGPFIHTAKTMVEACLTTNTHYLDITGEYQVFDLVQSYDDQAKEKGLMLLPGAGFDVVPSDCLAKHLHEQLPGATQLELAFVSKGGGLSRGTAKTMIENLGEPQVRREYGEYAFAKMGNRSKVINYGSFEQLSMAISWGDISTAFLSTGIPNIEVYSGTSTSQLKQVKRMNMLGPLMRTGLFRNLLKKQINKKPPGPSDDRRSKANMFLWGQVSNDTQSKEARLVTPNGYTLTASASIHLAKKIIEGNFKSGYQTPASAYGSGLILELDGCNYL